MVATLLWAAQPFGCVRFIGSGTGLAMGAAGLRAKAGCNHLGADQYVEPTWSEGRITSISGRRNGTFSQTLSQGGMALGRHFMNEQRKEINITGCNRPDTVYRLGMHHFTAFSSRGRAGARTVLSLPDLTHVRRV
jgi:hypothetical protein